MLRTLIDEAVQRAIKTAPQPAAVLLSGGVDSSTIAACARNLPAFTGFYQGEPYDEREYARLVVYGREHHEVEITPDDFVTYFDEVMRAVEPPFAGPGTFGQWMVARRVAQLGFKTVLSGEGGDELFGGYARLIKVAGGRVPDGYENYQPPADYPDTLEAALEYDWERLPDLLRVDEQVNGYHGLTAIAPMLDVRVVAMVKALPPDLRVGKVYLKTAMRGLVPEPILKRTDKRGFPVPFVEWAQHDPVKSFVADRIGYTPDPGKPWDRRWWLDMCEASWQPLPAAA
jgi:asparagine synthetase B (glutamine-hydrolysing)